jgi:hypothetical protein
MKKISIKYLIGGGLLSTTLLFAEGMVSHQQHLDTNADVHLAASTTIRGVFETDKYYDEPVYFYNGRYYYGGEYRDGDYYYDGQRLHGGEYHRDRRSNDRRREVSTGDIIKNAVIAAVIRGVFETDMYYNEPVYFYNGRYYYGGEYRNGNYYYDGRMLSGGEYYRDKRFYDRNQPRIIRNYHHGVFLTDRYYKEPVYVYKGKYYYGGKYRNGCYYFDGYRLCRGRYYPDPRVYYRKHYNSYQEDMRDYNDDRYNDRRDRNY